MPAVDRDLKITYGALVIGGAASGTSYHPHGKFSFAQSSRGASLEMDVIVQADTEAGFTSAEAALVAAFKAEQGALLVELGAQTRYSYNPAAGVNTAIYTRPRARKPGSTYDTARSALYRVSVDVDLPGPYSGGERDVTIDVRASGSGKRTVEIAGTWTASGSSSGTAAFQAAIAAYATSVLDAVGPSPVVWALVRPDAYRYDAFNKVVNFSRLAEELLTDEAQGARDHATLRNMSLVVQAHEPAGEDSDSTARRAIVLEAAYAVDVDKTVTTDLKGTWESLGLPRVRAAIENAAGGTVVYTGISPRFDHGRNAISATVTAEVYRSSLVSLSLHVLDQFSPGDVYIPRADGRDYSYEAQSLWKEWRRTVYRETREVAGLATDASVQARALIPAGPSGADGAAGVDGFLVKDVVGVDLEGFKILEEQSSRKRVYVGLPGSQQLQSLSTEIVTFLRVAETEGATGDYDGGAGGSEQLRQLTQPNFRNDSPYNAAP